MNLSMAVRAEGYHVPDNVSICRNDSMGVRTASTVAADLAGGCLDDFTEGFGKPSFLTANALALVMGLAKALSSHESGTSFYCAERAWDAPLEGSLTIAAPRARAVDANSAVDAQGSKHVGVRKHAPMEFTVPLSLMGLSASFHRTNAALANTNSDGTGHASNASGRTTAVDATRGAELAPSFRIMANAQAAGGMLRRTTFNGTQLHDRPSLGTVYHGRGQVAKETPYGWNPHDHTSSLLTYDGLLHNSDKVIFPNCGRLDFGLRPIKTRSDQWGKPEMATLNKQEQSVQLQRLSERAPVKGDATVRSHGNKNHESTAEMTVPCFA